MQLTNILLAVHKLALVWWLGGITMMTTIVVPLLRRAELAAADRHRLLARIRHRFVAHTRIALVLIGVSGAGMLWQLGVAHRLAFAESGGWLLLMLLTWSVFVIVIFVLEPLGLITRLSSNPIQYLRMQRFLLVLALLTVACGVVFA